MTFLLAQTVFLFSLDGLGHQIFHDPKISAPLKTLHKLAARGAVADGVQPAFPSTTANSHAALFTGVYGNKSHITANSQPLLPRGEHTFLQRGSGFRSDQLAVEPVWVAAAKRGIKAVVYQAPQAYPFRPLNTHANAISLNGYQSRRVAGARVLRRKDLVEDGPGRFRFAHGPVTLQGEFLKNGLRIGGITVRPAPAAKTFSNAKHFSAGLYLDSPIPAVIYFRLFSYGPEDLLLYVSPIQELAMSQGDARELLREAGGFIGNSFSGKALDTWQKLETSELVARQNLRHTVWLYRRHAPRFFIGYLPTADEVGHSFLGRWEKGDPEGIRALTKGFEIVEHWSRGIAQLVGKQDHLIVTADHGMAATDKLVNINEALRRAGLGSVASHIYNSILINSTDWKNGTVRDRNAVRNQVKEALAALRNPGPVVAGFYTPEEHEERYGIGGPAGSDLYFDLAKGYYVRDSVGELFPVLDEPVGTHGHLPDRPDMLATFFMVGPTVTKGSRLPRMRSIEVAPLAARLLGISFP